MSIKLSAESILSQMPGVFALKEVRGDKSYYAFGSLTFAKMIGFKNVDEIIGLTDEDAKSDEIISGAKTFYLHDKFVMTGKTIRTLDVYPYRIDNFVGILGVKKPFLDENNKICGVLAQGIALKKADLQKILANVPDLNNLSKGVGKSIVNTYQIRNDLDCLGLTSKEFECFFYLLRGKSTADISSILCRSARTIETHIENIKNKFGLSKKSELFDFAYTHGLINAIPHTFVVGTKTLDV
jgi:DNA-binding CsgD family transcriptional regulator